ncbi:hypothetical protein FKM82_016495 [Ascaphus truei]
MNSGVFARFNMNDYMSSMDVDSVQNEILTRSSSMGRPSAKSIYQQRKQYAQSLTKLDSTIQHRVEHLLTCDLDSDLRTVNDCLTRLHSLTAEGRVWGQDLILQVNNGEMLLNDVETRDSLERVPLQSVESCHSVLGGSTYNSLLSITVQNPQKSIVFLFQCDELPADVLQRKLEAALSQCKGNRESRDNIRSNLETVLSQSLVQPTPGGRTPTLDYPSRGSSRNETPILERRRFDLEPPQTFRPPPATQTTEINQDIDILNHTLADIEIFIGKLNTNNNKKKRGKSVVPESEFIDCLQKIKYSFNILGKVKDDMQQPSAPDLIHILMTTVPTVLSQCPRKNVAPTVVSPLLTQKALTLLSSCVTEKERNLWQSLGDAWQRTRADWPNGKNVPPYIPEFSDGWIPSKIPDEMPPREDQAQFPPEEQTPPINRRSQMLIMRVLHDFEARNSRELSVKKGDSVEVLDQSRQWWMVQNYRQERGFIPSNILESGEEAQVPVHSLSLQPSSRPEEVTAWLQEKDFSTITVRCLGVLRGSQLLGLSREELKAVCPEEGGRVYTQLNEVRAALRI